MTPGTFAAIVIVIVILSIAGFVFQEKRRLRRNAVEDAIASAGPTASGRGGAGTPLDQKKKPQKKRKPSSTRR